MWHSWSVQAVRQTEAAAVQAAATDQLMLKAARAVADAVRRQSPNQVVAYVGGGDNAGDALYALSFLAHDGIPSVAVLVSDHPHERALAAAREANVEIIGGAGEGGATSAPSRTGDDRDDTRPAADGRDGPRPTADAPDDPRPTADAPDDPRPTTGDLLQQVEATALAADVWIDALVGTGARGPLREPVASVVQTLARLHHEATQAAPGVRRTPRVIAVDVHSGTCSDDGRVENPILPADDVVTMGAVKAALVLPPASYHHGDITLVDLALDLSSIPAATTTLQSTDVACLLTPPSATDHKYTRAVVRTTCGSARYPGAGVLSALASQYSGASMVRLDAPAPVTQLALAREPGLVTGVGRAQCVVVGSGMDPEHEDDRARIESALSDAARADIPLVVDAGALSVAAQWGREQLPSFMVWTPHAGEAAQLLTQLTQQEWSRAEVEAAPRVAAERISELTGAMVVLKGAATVLVGPVPTGAKPVPVVDEPEADGPGERVVRVEDENEQPRHHSGDSAEGNRRFACYVQAEAPSWAATAGSGDVLAGALGTALANLQVWRERARQEAAGDSGTGLAGESGQEVPQAVVPFWRDTQVAPPTWEHLFLRAAAAGVWLHGTAASLAAQVEIRGPIRSAAKLAALAHVHGGSQGASEAYRRGEARKVFPAPTVRASVASLPAVPTRPQSQIVAAPKETWGRPITAADIAEHLPAAVDYALCRRR